jgi:5'-methylthioadenosine/S-adenosylhomocysteine nucleosidase
LAGKFLVLALIASPVFADTAVLYALPSELTAIQQELRMAGQPVRIADRQIHVGYRKGEKVILAQSGSGQIPAAITTQAVLQRFKPHRLISIGPAGNLRDDWKVGDVVVASEIVHYESGSEKAAGFILKEGAKSRADFAERCEKLRQAAKTEIVAANSSSVSSNSARQAENDNVIVRFARFASGDKFIATSSKRTWLRETFQADAVDMMSAAIAKTCEANDVPFVLIRVLSDNADENASTDFAAFIQGSKEPVTARIAIGLIDQVAKVRD